MADLAFRINEPGTVPREVSIVDGLTLGRAADSTCKVNDPKASGRHARIVVEGESTYIEDVGSSNHTVIQNGPILKAGERHLLAPGVTVMIGDSHLVVVMKGGAAKTIAAHVAFGRDDSQSSETAEPLDPNALNTLADRASFETARPRLILCNEAFRKILPVDQARWTIGRSGEQTQCAIDHPAVSTVHAQIAYSQRHFFLEDQGSRNGTFLNGEQISPGQRAEIEPESHLRFGSVDAFFVVDCDADGRKADPNRWRNALEVLVADGKITRLQREEAQRKADERDHHPGEILLELGYVTPEQWRDALRRGEFVVINRVVAKSGGGLKVVILLIAALVVVGVALAILKPDLLHSIGIGGGR